MRRDLIILALLLILTFLMVGCSKSVREIAKTTGSVAIVGSAISPTGGVIAGATTYIMELMDYDRNSEVPTIKTPEQAIVELGDRLLIFIFLGFLPTSISTILKNTLLPVGGKFISIGCNIVSVNRLILDPYLRFFDRRATNKNA
jgi:uncharacterized membrane-anchored protein